MARPKKATVDYFPHTTDQGPTLFILEERWGNDGYAAWYKILERLGASDGHFIDCRKAGTWHHLQAYTKVKESILTEILDVLAELEAIDTVLWSYRVIYSQNFVDGIKDAYRRREDNLPTRGKVFAITNVQSKEFLTAETLPKEVYPVRSTERERERERERENKDTTTTARTQIELAFLEVFADREERLKEVFPQHDFEVVKEGCLVYYREGPRPVDIYQAIYKWFQREQVGKPAFQAKHKKGFQGISDDLEKAFS